MTNAPHPQVARRAAVWQILANRHGVETCIGPMKPYPDGLIIAFKTGLSDEFGHALIYPPREGEQRTRQTLMVHGWRDDPDGSIYFGWRDLTRAQFVTRLVEGWSSRAHWASIGRASVEA